MSADLTLNLKAVDNASATVQSMSSKIAGAGEKISNQFGKMTGLMMNVQNIFEAQSIAAGRLENSQLALSAAQIRLTETAKDVVKAQKESQRAIEDAERKVKDAEATAKTAAYNVEAAERRLADARTTTAAAAVQTLKDAEQSLMDQRQRAKDLADSVIGGELSVRDARFGLEDANKRLGDAEAALMAAREAGKPDAIAEAEDKLARAKLNVDQAAFRLKESEESLADTRIKAVEAADQIGAKEGELESLKGKTTEKSKEEEAAEKALEQARSTQVKAIEGIQTAVAAMAITQEDAAEKIEDAQSRQQLAADAVTTAQNNLVRTQMMVDNTMQKMYLTTLPQLGASLFGMGGQFMKAASVAKTSGLTISTAMGPIGIIIMAIMALLPILTTAWNENWGDIQGITKGVMDFIVGFVKWGINLIIDYINLWIKGINLLVGAYNMLAGALKLPELAPIAEIPHLKLGGIVDKPTVALLGEAGPEAVVPLNRGFGGGVNITLIVEGSADRKTIDYAKREIWRELRSVIQENTSASAATKRIRRR